MKALTPPASGLRPVAVQAQALGAQMRQTSGVASFNAARAILSSPDIILAAPPAIFPGLCKLLSIDPDLFLSDGVIAPSPASVGECR